MKIYVASSWRNRFQPDVVVELREDGHEVYDFRHPEEGNNGFHWSSIDPDWQAWSPRQYISCLTHPLAESGFAFDMGALRKCDACIYVMPCGVSASLEAGWAKGAGKLLCVYTPDLREPDLMVKMADLVTHELSDIKTLLRGVVCRRDPWCRWCAQGMERVPSAVLPGGFVHLFTPSGRVKCTLETSSPEQP